MADSKATGLTENTDPQLTDALYFIDNPGGVPASNKITVANLMTRAPLMMYGGFTYSAPADGTTYYFGSLFHNAITTTAASRRIYIQRAGVITDVDIYMNCTVGDGALGSLYLRLNNTSDTLLTNAVNLSVSPFHYLKTGLNISVAVADYVEFKWVCPTWPTTNPTNVLGEMRITQY